jgi:hypothetical protein
MKQPMTKTEIDVWDSIAVSKMRNCKTSAEFVFAYSYATKAIAARRAALIADAYVGLHFRDGDSGDWNCHCMVGEYGGRRYKANHDDVEYCESCHTRRPDAVYKATSDKQDCSTCKHEQSEWSEEPCNNCEFMSRWEMPDAVQGEVQEQKFENDAGKSCRNCKHKLKHWENEPCKSCDFSDKWEVHK